MKAEGGRRKNGERERERARGRDEGACALEQSATPWNITNLVAVFGCQITWPGKAKEDRKQVPHNKGGFGGKLVRGMSVYKDL